MQAGKRKGRKRKEAEKKKQGKKRMKNIKASTVPSVRIETSPGSAGPCTVPAITRSRPGRPLRTGQPRVFSSASARSPPPFAARGWRGAAARGGGGKERC